MERLSFHTRVGQPAYVRLGVPEPFHQTPGGGDLGYSGDSKPDADHEGAHAGHPSPFPVSNIGGGIEIPFPFSQPQTVPPARAFGYPIPGPQDPTAESVVGTNYFVRENDFEKILEQGDYDYIVIGSSFMALAFIQGIWEENANARILVLERGSLWLPSHFQNLPLPFNYVLGGRSETFPWTLSESTYTNPNVEGLQMAFLRGSCPFFGGKSVVWSAWSPQPPEGLFRGFPDSMLETIRDKKFWPDAKRLLNVKGADEIKAGAFGPLQAAVDKILKEKLKTIPTATYSEPAQLAVGPNHSTSSIRFTKYSVPGPLLALVEKFRTQFTINIGRVPRRGTLKIVTNCVVERLTAQQGKSVRAIETNRGTLSFASHNTKIILCAGVVPNTTLVLNSFPKLRGIAGKRLTGHIMSHVVARVAKEAFDQKGDALQIAAHYLAGSDKTTSKNLQYHIQISAMYCPKPEEQLEDLTRESPDFAAAPTMEQLDSSRQRVVFVCATLGEIDERSQNSVTLNDGVDPTTNVTVKYEFSEDEKKLWGTMEKATFDTLKAMVGTHTLEYWHEGRGSLAGSWKSERPPIDELRIPGIVHEASGLFMGEEKNGGSIRPDYGVHGTDNVYVTGAAIFPTCGSWNPTLAMCGFAQDLAKKLEKK